MKRPRPSGTLGATSSSLAHYVVEFAGSLALDIIEKNKYVKSNEYNACAGLVSLCNALSYTLARLELAFDRRDNCGGICGLSRRVVQQEVGVRTKVSTNVIYVR